jgi:hypothetical protein
MNRFQAIEIDSFQTLNLKKNVLAGLVERLMTCIIKEEWRMMLNCKNS